MVFTGCVSQKVIHNQEPSSLSNISELWTANTISRLDSSHAVYGGYSDFPPEEPTLYSTFYSLESLKLLDKEPQNKQATIDWLLSQEQMILKQNNSSNIREIYFLTMSLDILGTKPANSSSLTSKIMELQASNGSFVEEKGDEGTLLDTFRAVTALHSLGVDLNQVPSTKSWLIEKWGETEGSSSLMDSTAETSMLISMLELYNVNIYSQNKSPRMEKLTEQKSIVENQLESLPDAEMDLFTLNSFTDFLLINGSISPEIQSGIGTYLQREQLQDGGFNLLSEDYGEQQGTYLALKIASKIGLSLNDNVSTFIYNCETLDGSGGFRPAYRLIPSPENTYLAIESLKILGSEPEDKEKILRYIADEWQEGSKDTKNAYYLLMVYKLLNCSYPQDVQFEEWVKRSLDECANQPVESMNYEETFYLAKLTNLLGIDLNNRDMLIAKMQSIQQKDGGFGFEDSDLFMTFYVVNILEELGSSPLNREGCISWIQEGQVDDGGFIIRRGPIHTNSSDIYSTYMSVVSLNALDAEPKDSDKLLEWLRDCQYEYGGFKFAPEYADLDASADTFEASLEYTNWGLISWNVLSKD
ncbi:MULTISPECIES: prenyltransferase/squalene oxidase repeat-containing protein [Methanosarcina]|uniref:prenyltransferase/squalene oxidase repeat-containing protein n=1 Tax=Methanosarcina TaxID=2207 RepID=UPI00138DE942|nr:MULTISPECIES: prenyltransferase/squalene oxidase repeat-containing protein [Methanosarcina]